MKVGSLATMVLMTNEVQSFTLGWSSKPRPMTTLGMGLQSYQDQLNSYVNGDTSVQDEADSHAFTVYPKEETFTVYPNEERSSPVVNGAAPYSPPVQQVQQMEPANLDGQLEETGKNPLAVGGIVFLGLPLWLLTTQLFFGGGSSSINPQSAQPPSAAAPPTQIVVSPKGLSNEMRLPASVMTPAMQSSAASPAGVVVLSQPITKAEVRGLFNLWNNALSTLDPDTVAQRYAKDGVLLPTLSDRPRNDYEGIKDYFVGFLKKKPVGKILEGEIFVGNNWAQDAGIYEFTFEDGSAVKARYSFIYVYEGGKWMISHHHSSLMPEETVRVTKITRDEVRRLFDLWNNALATGDPQKVADRYTEDAVLLPTVSNEVRYTNARVADYFIGFLKKKPTGEILEGNIKIGPNWAQDAGIYEFTFMDGSKIKGRYSFVYTFDKGEWKIANHHSSIMPEGAVAALKKVAAIERAALEPY